MIKLRKYKTLLALLCLLICSESCNNSKKIQVPASNSIIPFKETFHQANSEKVIGHNEQAIKLFTKCLVLKPNSAASHFGLAQIYNAQKNSQKAIEHGKEAFVIDENNKWYTEFLGSQYFEMGDYHNSAVFYDLLIEKHRDRNIDNLSKLAQSYIYSNQKEKAISTLNKMEAEMGVSPMTSLTKHDLYQELNKPELAEVALQKLFNENALNINVALEVMDYFLQTRQYDKALSAIQEVKKREPSNIYSMLGEAEVSLSKKDIEQTFSLLSMALPSQEIQEDRKVNILESLMSMGFDKRYQEADLINKKLTILMRKLSPYHANSAKFLNLYGQFLTENSEKDSAQIYFERALKVDPNNYDTWLSLMDANYNSEDYQKVISEADKALTFFPNQPMIYLLKGISEYELSDYLKAEETLFSGQQLVIDNKDLEAEFTYHLTKNKWQQNDKIEAGKDFEKLFESNPFNSRFLFGYGQLQNADNNYDKAIYYAKKAFEMEMRNAEYAAFYATLLFKEKNYADAQKVIEKAIVADSKNSGYMESYGDIMFFQNQVEKAVEIWKEAYEMKPSGRLEVKIKTKSYHE